MTDLFQSAREAQARLSRSEKMSLEEVRGVLVYRANLTAGDLERVRADLAIYNLEAIQEFDRNSARLTRWLLWMTGALVAMTAALVALTVVLTHFTIQLVHSK